MYDTPLLTSLCSSVYANDLQVLDLIDDTTALCVDTSSVDSYNFGQQNFELATLKLSVTNCQSMLIKYFDKTRQLYPDADSLVCDSSTILANPQAVSATVKVLARQFNQQVWRANGGGGIDSMDWYLLLDQTQGFVNNTAVTMNVNFDQVETRVGDNAMLNSDFFSFSTRESLKYVQVAASNMQFNMFNYDILATKDTLIGEAPLYLTWNFQLSTNLITNTVDLRRGFVGSLALFGGFMIAIYTVILLCVCSCRKFEADKTMASKLYTLNPDGMHAGQ